MATIFLVGDGHFCGAPGEAARWRALLDAAYAAGARDIAILGDFLELWIGLPGLETAWLDALLAPLKELRGRGVRLTYVVGNKDYFIERFNKRHGLFDAVVDPGCTVETTFGPLHLAHGDLVNRRDRQYRLWRWFSRSWPMRLLALLWPRRSLARLSERVALRLQGTNRYHKSYFPEAELRARARELPPGRATLVFGHFHVHRELVEGDKRIVTLPFLGAEHAGVLVDEAGEMRRVEVSADPSTR